jgi:hypothetical protein
VIDMSFDLSADALRFKRKGRAKKSEYSKKLVGRSLTFVLSTASKIQGFEVLHTLISEANELAKKLEYQSGNEQRIAELYIIKACALWWLYFEYDELVKVEVDPASGGKLLLFSYEMEFEKIRYHFPLRKLKEVSRLMEEFFKVSIGFEKGVALVCEL